MVNYSRTQDLLRAPDTHTNRPAATAVPAGALYECTTHNCIYRSDGAAWATWTYTLPAGTTDADVATWDAAAGKWKSAASTGGGGTSPRTKIADSGALAAVAASIDFASIPATYDDLELVFLGKHATSTAAVAIRLTLNNDTTDANYKRSYQYADSAGGSGGANVADRVTAQLNGTGPTLARWLIPRYADTTFQKEYGSEVVNSGVSLVQYGALWANTAAINRLTLTLVDGLNFAIGTRVRLYGLKDV